jgi:purine-cytosine permease-like protein
MIQPLFLEFTPPFFQIFTPVLIVLFSLLLIVNIEDKELSFLFIVIPAIIIISQYFVLKREIRRGKYDFERELTHITQKYPLPIPTY